MAKLVAAIQGGSRTHSGDKPLVLDASSSSDLGGSVTADDMHFEWQCYRTNGRAACFSDLLDTNVLSNSARLVIGANLLAPGMLFSVPCAHVFACARMPISVLTQFIAPLVQVCVCGVLL